MSKCSWRSVKFPPSHSRRVNVCLWHYSGVWLSVFKRTNVQTPHNETCFILSAAAAVRAVRRWGGVQQQRERQSCCSAEEQMGETRQGRMNSGQKEGDSRAWPPTCPPHTSPSVPVSSTLTPLSLPLFSTFLHLPLRFNVFPSVSFFLPFGGVSSRSHPGVGSLHTRSDVIGKGSGRESWSEGGWTHCQPSMLTTQILISNRGMVNIFIKRACEGYLARGCFKYLHRPFYASVQFTRMCVFFFFIFHMKLSELFVFFLCSFLMKLDGFQTPESEICNASLFFLLLLFSVFFLLFILLTSLFDGSRPKNKKHTKSPLLKAAVTPGRLGADAEPETWLLHPASLCKAHH